jgi:hypothetical protein
VVDKGPTDWEKVDKVITLARQGDKKTLPVAREMLNRLPSIWEQLGNTALQAERIWIQVIAGKDPLVQEGIQRKLSSMRTELLGAESTPIERLLVDRVIACWLQLHYADAIYGQHIGELTINQAEYHQRRLDRAQRRYLQAIITLAQVRRLLGPTVQINVGEKQINLAGRG